MKYFFIGLILLICKSTFGQDYKYLRTIDGVAISYKMYNGLLYIKWENRNNVRVTINVDNIIWKRGDYQVSKVNGSQFEAKAGETISGDYSGSFWIYPKEYANLNMSLDWYFDNLTIYIGGYGNDPRYTKKNNATTTNNNGSSTQNSNLKQASDNLNDLIKKSADRRENERLEEEANRERAELLYGKSEPTIGENVGTLAYSIYSLFGNKKRKKAEQQERLEQYREERRRLEIEKNKVSKISENYIETPLKKQSYSLNYSNEWIQKKWNEENHYITNIFSTKGSYSVVMSTNPNYINQLYRTSQEFPYDTVLKYRDNSYYLTDATYDSTLGWRIVMTKPKEYYKQYFTSDVSVDSVKKYWNQAYAITLTIPVDEEFMFVMTKGTKITEQSYWTTSIFPTDWIKQKWENEYYITNLSYQNGKYLTVMSKSTSFTNQTYNVSEAFPTEWIQKKWNEEDYRITAINNDSGKYIVVMTKFK